MLAQYVGICNITTKSVQRPNSMGLSDLCIMKPEARGGVITATLPSDPTWWSV